MLWKYKRRSEALPIQKISMKMVNIRAQGNEDTDFRRLRQDALWSCRPLSAFRWNESP